MNIPDDTECSPMEVTRGTEDDSLALRNSFLLIGPFPRELDRRLDSFRAGVHGKHHIISKHSSDLLCEPTEDTIVERS